MKHNKIGTVGTFLSGVFVTTAIGGYLLFVSKNAKRNRQKVQDDVEDAKADVATKLKKIKRLSRDKYHEIVEDISDKYSEVRKMGTEKADEIRDELQASAKKSKKR